MTGVLVLLAATALGAEPLGYEAWVRATAWTTPALEAAAHAKRSEALERLEPVVVTLEGEPRIELELRMGQMLLEEGLAMGEEATLERAAAAFGAVLAVEKHARRDEALLGRGRALHALGRDDEARVLVERLLAKDPPSSWRPEATAVLAELDPERRPELLAEVADQRGTAAAWAQYRLGYLDHDAGLHGEERIRFGNAIELHPGAITVIAQAIGFLHAYELAPVSDPVTYVEVDQACQETPDPTPEAWVQATWCWYDQRDMARAKVSFEGLKQRYGRGSGWWKRAPRAEKKEMRKYLRTLDGLIRP